MLSSPDQLNLQSPDVRLNRPDIEFQGSEAIHQRRAGLNKRHIDPANVQIPSMREQVVDAGGVIDNMHFEAPRSGNYRDKVGSATKRAGINTFWVEKTRTSRSQVDCKR